MRVLRLQVGDSITLFDGCGSVAEGLITAVNKKSVEINVTMLTESPPPSTYPVHLFQALIRNDKMDLIIQKAVELGAKSITPVI